MTDYEKEQVQRLQSQGIGYKKIAMTLDLPINGVKSYCRRHPATGADAEQNNLSGVCLNCGITVEQTPHRKAKKFCSDACRQAWWNAHLGDVRRKAYHQYTCPQCGQRFESYSNKPRIYCSRACYAKARQKVV